jgi:hypothetical protein
VAHLRSLVVEDDKYFTNGSGIDNLEACYNYDRKYMINVTMDADRNTDTLVDDQTNMVHAPHEEHAINK